MPSHMATNEHWELRCGDKVQSIAHAVVTCNTMCGTVHMPAILGLQDLQMLLSCIV